MGMLEEIELLARTVCSLTTDECFDYLASHYGFTVRGSGPGFDRFAIREGTLPIVGVCHLDTVLGNTDYHYVPDRNLIVCSELDDRLGLACLLWMIGNGYDVTVVCCDHEERGASTGDVAADWILDNGIPCNWLFELDRCGTDVVSYDYEEPLWDGILGHYFERVGFGSFSDICRMESLGVKGFNAGIGYHREHTVTCHADLRDTVRQVGYTCQMIDDCCKVRMPHVPVVRSNKPSTGFTFSYDYDDDYPVPMVSTGASLTTIEELPDIETECVCCGLWFYDIEDEHVCDDCRYYLRNHEHGKKY